MIAGIFCSGENGGLRLVQRTKIDAPLLIGPRGKEGESGAVGGENGRWSVIWVQLCVGANFCGKAHGLKLFWSSQDEADSERQGN